MSIRAASAWAVGGALLLVGFLAFGVFASFAAPSARATDLPRLTAVTSGLSHYCALGEDGSVWCWGINNEGQLGDGTMVSSYDTPVRVQGLPGPVRQVVAFLFTTCAVTENGAVWCWGNNDEGQLGDGTTIDSSTPIAVPGAQGGVASLAEGDSWGSCALREDASAICWGSNFAGRMGDVPDDVRLGATKLTIVNDRLTEMVDMGGTMCAVTEAGAVRCWGLLWATDETWFTEEGINNWQEAYDRGLNDGPITPKGLAGGVKSIAGGSEVACVLMVDGSVRCWDWMLGDREAGRAWSVTGAPEAVSGIPAGLETIFVSRFANDASVCGLVHGVAWCWGDNQRGQLGDGTLIDRSAPVKVQTEGIAALAMESSPVLALLADGSLLVWGDTDPPTPHSPFSDGSAPAPTPNAFRAPGPLAPTITTQIPTPADISTDPPVVGTNLLLAALAMIAFTISIELLNRSLAAGEGLFRRRLAPLSALDSLRARVDSALFGRLGRAHVADVLRILGIAFFYGIAFALLDPTWNPLSVTGIALVVMMAVAAGLVGLGDDVASWSVARRWGAATELSVRAGSLVTALASVLATRVLVLVPGVMIGAPEALEIEEEGLDRQRQGQLALAGVGTVLVVGGVAWAGSLATTLLRGSGEGLDVVLGGIEALLLLVFAVAVQNAFVQLLAFRGSAGRALLRSHRVIWAGTLLGVTFAFWHTLVNPRGDLAAALGATNVQAFLVTVGVVLAVAVVAWLITLGSHRGTAGRLMPPPPQSPPSGPTYLPPPPPPPPPFMPPPPPPPFPSAGRG